MTNNLKKFESFLNADLIRILQNTEIIDITQLNALIALLVKLNLPFAMKFTQATNEIVASAELEIILSPTFAITLLLPFGRGPI